MSNSNEMARFYVWLIKTCCRHIPCGHGDQQTFDGLNNLQAAAVDYMLGVLRPLGLVIDDVYQPVNKPGRSGRANFIVLDIPEGGPVERKAEWLRAENLRLTQQLEQMQRDMHRMDLERGRLADLLKGGFLPWRAVADGLPELSEDVAVTLLIDGEDTNWKAGYWDGQHWYTLDTEHDEPIQVNAGCNFVVTHWAFVNPAEQGLTDE